MGSTSEEIKKYPFTEEGLQELKKSQRGKNWPVVYMIHDESNLYIGETTSAATRMGQHLKNDEKKNLTFIEVIDDGEFNKSVVLDYEQRLIKYCSVDKRFKNILNKNKGQQASHDYYNRSMYRSNFRVLWHRLKENGLVSKSLNVIENDNIFKYSPYSALTREQNDISVSVINDILDSFKNNHKGISLIDGCAGTGKTVLGISIINSLINAVNIDDEILQENTSEYAEDIDEEKKDVLKRLKYHILNERNGKPFKIGFVFPMPGIRGTVKKVFKECGNGLVQGMVISPYDIIKEEYDIIVVDESHRLSKRKNLTNYQQFDNVCKKLNMDKSHCNQLDWILTSAKHVVLFYDQYQSVKSSDVTYNEYHESLEQYKEGLREYKLITQMRCEGGDSYLNYIRTIMDCSCKQFKRIENYKFLLFDDVNDMINIIREKDKEIGLCKTVAGFAWDWKTKPKNKVKNNLNYYNQLFKNGEFDISIGEYKYIWNLSSEDWVTREDSHYTIGCIHTTQGYDLNYVGVILGEEIDYDEKSNSIKIDLNKYKDTKVKDNTDKHIVEELILHTYTTILARGIKGCYVYACNPRMKAYLEKYIAKANVTTLNE